MWLREAYHRGIRAALALFGLDKEAAHNKLRLGQRIKLPDGSLFTDAHVSQIEEHVRNLGRLTEGRHVLRLETDTGEHWGWGRVMQERGASPYLATIIDKNDNVRGAHVIKDPCRLKPTQVVYRRR